jgi:hypothetical protein
VQQGKKARRPAPAEARLVSPSSYMMDVTIASPRHGRRHHFHFRSEAGHFHCRTGEGEGRGSDRIRISTVQFFKIHTLNKYVLCTYSILQYSIFNPPYSSYSKFILSINYHSYFIIFHTTDFFSLIPISTTIIFLFISLPHSNFITQK